LHDVARQKNVYGSESRKIRRTNKKRLIPGKLWQSNRFHNIIMNNIEDILKGMFKG
jgi:hypothetical protein